MISTLHPFKQALLDSWARSNTAHEGYRVAREHILSAVECKLSSLSLQQLSLSSLPDIFDDVALQHLHHCDLSHNRFVSFPEAINAVSWRTINFAYNISLQNLSAHMHVYTSLQYFDISACVQLSEIELSHLQYLPPSCRIAFAHTKLDDIAKRHPFYYIASVHDLFKKIHR